MGDAKKTRAQLLKELEDLRESEQRFRTLVEHSMDPMSIINADGSIRYLSRSFERLLGYTTEQRVGASSLDTVHPDDLDRATTAFAELLQDRGGTVQTEIRVRHRDGYWCTLEVVGYNLLDDPSVQGIVSSYRDVTRRKHAEAAGSESEAKYAALVQQARDGVAIIEDGVIRFANRATEEISGYTVDELVGMDFLDVVLPEEKEEYARRFQRRVSGRDIPDFIESRIPRKDGTLRDLEVTGQLVTYEGRPAYMVIIRDVTERKRAEEELEQYQLKLEELVEQRTSRLETTNQQLRREITKRKKSEDELRRSEERFRSIVEALPLPALISRSSDGRILYANRHVATTFGIDSEEIKAFSTSDFYEDPSDREAVVRAIAEQGHLYDYELRARRPDGTPLWAMISIHPMVFEGEDALLTSFHDITERKEAEEELLRQEQYFRALIENSLEGITVASADGSISYEGPTSGRVLGYSGEELIGRGGFDLVHPEDVTKVIDAYTQVLATPGETARVEMRARHKDGSWRHIEASGYNLLDHPAVQGIVVNFHDITERKEVEEALRHKEEYFRSLIENSSEVFVVLNGDGTIRYESPSLERVTGYKVEERQGKSIMEFVHPDDMPGLVQQLSAILERPGATVTARFRGFWKLDGQWHHVEGSGTNLLHDPAVQGIIVNFRDVTEREEAQKRLQEAYDQEKDLRKRLEEEMNSKAEFTKTLTHELRTPLTSVLASTDLLMSEAKDETLLRLAKNINWAASNLNTRVNELLDLARMDSGMLQIKLESLDVLEVLREAATSMAPVATSQGLSLLSELPPYLPPIQGDRGRLRQVVLNLLDNAIKFTPRRGRITLRAIRRDADIIVEVQDTGRGISRKDQNLIFEPYHRIERDEGTGGLGLGLALCKTLVELHGGQMWVSSRRGKGSVFAFSVPVEDVPQPATGPAPAEKHVTVLLIEDDQTIVDAISLAFQIRWPEAQLVSTRLGEEGIDLIETESPDIVILDLGLPDMSGFDVLEEVRKFTSIPVVILTVKGEEAEIAGGLELGADDYIVKPFKQMELLARLKVQLRRKAPADQGQPISYGALRYDPSTLQLRHNGVEIGLTTIEGHIVECLMRNAGQVVSHSSLAEAVWGDDYPGAIHSLRVNIQRLRAKIEQDPGKPTLIITKPGVGYMMAKPSYG